MRVKYNLARILEKGEVVQNGNSNFTTKPVGDNKKKGEKRRRKKRNGEQIQVPAGWVNNTGIKHSSVTNRRH